MALTANEKRLAHAAFYRGPEVLLSEGYTRDSLAAFAERKDVQEYWLQLKREYDIHEGLRARSKFAALRNLHAMIDPASAVLAQALAGPEYLRDQRGIIQRDAQGRPMLVHAEVSQRQLHAARFVIDSVGVSDHKIQGDAASDPSLKLLFASAEEDATVLDDDPLLTTEEQRALSRERIRNALFRLSPRVIDAHVKVRTGLGLEAPKKTPKAKRAVKKGAHRGKKEG